MSKKEEVVEEKDILQDETTKEEIETKPKEKKNKIIFIILGIIFMLLLCAGAFVLGTKFANNEDKNKDVSSNTEEKENNENEDKKEPEEEKLDKEKYKYQVNLYGTADGYVCGNKSDYCTKKVLSIPAETKNATIKDYTTTEKNEPTFILISDSTYKVYDVKKDKLHETPIANEASATLHTNEEFSEVYGFVYESEEISSYYNLLTKKEMYTNKYDNLTPIFGKYIEGFITNDEDDPEDDKTLLLSTAEEKVELSTIGMCTYYDVYEFEEGNFFVETEGCFAAGYSKIYNNNKKIISSNKEAAEWSIDDNGNLYILSNNKVEKYNTNGKLLSTSKTYSKPLHLIKEYVLYIENDYIYISDGKEATKIGKWEKDFYYHSMISGYYDANSLDNENEKDAGIYLIFEYGEMDEGPGIEYYFNPKTKKVKKYDLEYVGGYAKPVLYLYPEEKTDITVNFEKEENLTTTYPKFKDEWKVTAYPNGDLYDKNGKYYYGLYWEEDSNHKVDFQEGFYVSKENAISFLEEKLSIIGLNDKERNEFIMYWLPILEKNEHNLVYFELTEERDSFNKIEISPKPDSLLRMAIHVKKLDKKTNIKEQKLTSFKRTGFTAVEWGGVTY